MKKIILIFVSMVLFSLVLISCSDSKEVDSISDNGVNSFVSGDYADIGGAWATDCPNEYWDRVLSHDCYGEPDNCVVVCADRKNQVEYSNFVSNINNGNSADYYENGNGQLFLPLKTQPYNDLINGLKKIVKVPAGQDEYAIVDINF